MKHRLASSLAVLALFASSIRAQSSGGATLTVAPEVLTSGETVTVSYSNPDMAGETVTIEVDNGMQKNTQTQQITIVLDADGKGSADWVVPSWFSANFNAPDVGEVHCPILGSTGSSAPDQTVEDRQMRGVDAQQDVGPAAIAHGA